MSQLVIPGTRLMPADPSITPGPGTFVLQEHIYASVVGHVHLESVSASTSRLEVRLHSFEAVVPKVNDIVTCRVLSVTSRMARLHILCVGSTPLPEPFRATLRKEDVRAREKDRVEMPKSVRPKDVVLAKVIGLGESNTGFVVSTADNELGVVIARGAESNVKLVPVSWTEMQCPLTKMKENRKVAKVIPENLAHMAKEGSAH